MKNKMFHVGMRLCTAKARRRIQAFTAIVGIALNMKLILKIESDGSRGSCFFNSSRGRSAIELLSVWTRTEASEVCRIKSMRRHHAGMDCAPFKIFSRSSGDFLCRSVIPPLRKKSRSARLFGCKRPHDGLLLLTF